MPLALVVVEKNIRNAVENKKETYWWEEYFQKFLDGFHIKLSEGLELESLKQQIEYRQNNYSSIGEFRLRDICKRQVEMINKKLEDFVPKEKEEEIINAEIKSLTGVI